MMPLLCMLVSGDVESISWYPPWVALWVTDPGQLYSDQYNSVFDTESDVVAMSISYEYRAVPRGA